MSDLPIRAVIDTVVLLQAMISNRGPSAAIMDALRGGQFIALFSDATRAELLDVSHRPKIRARFPQITDQRVAALLDVLARHSIHIPSPSKAFSLTRDPKDEPLIDVAVNGVAGFLVTWNERHLTYLMRGDTSEGRDFLVRFPYLKIVSPVDFLNKLKIS